MQAPMLRDPFVGLIVPAGAVRAPIVLGGEWPHDRRAVAISDTAEGPALNEALVRLRKRFPQMVHVGLYEASGEPVSLRECVRRLEEDSRLAFAQSGSVTVWRDAELEAAGDFPALDRALTAA
jgi:hypothetical protein